MIKKQSQIFYRIFLHKIHKEYKHLCIFVGNYMYICVRVKRCIHRYVFICICMYVYVCIYILKYSYGEHYYVDTYINIRSYIQMYQILDNKVLTLKLVGEYRKMQGQSPDLRENSHLEISLLCI
jgi:hypothetical protein